MGKDNWGKKIDQIVEYLCDCEWHTADEIQYGFSLKKNAEEYSAVFQSLEELGFVETDGEVDSQERIRGTERLKKYADLPVPND